MSNNIRVRTGGIAVGMCLIILELGLEVLLWVCVIFSCVFSDVHVETKLIFSYSLFNPSLSTLLNPYLSPFPLNHSLWPHLLA